MASAALDAAKPKAGSRLAALKEANAQLGPEHVTRVEREAQRQIVDEYFARLEAGVDAELARHAEAKTRGTDPSLTSAQRAKKALPAGRAKALAELKEPTRYTNAAEWEASLVGLTPDQRVALVMPEARRRADHFGWTPRVDAQIVRRNRLRTLYTDGELIYSVDTQHGRFEVHDRRGKHLRETNFDGAQTDGPDKSGQHDLR